MANTIGEQLKQTREERGLSIEQASRAIHVRQHYLEALENDQQNALPSKVQGRGFLRLYAGLLDLPVEPLLAAWDGKVLVEPIPEMGESPADKEDFSDVKTTLPDLPESDLDDSSEMEDTTEQVESIVEKSSDTIFREIGQTLRSQREALGLSLEEVERYTRLRQHYIRALEEGRLEKLPSPVQGRGMLSNYSAFLNLNEDIVLLRFAEGLQARRIERLPEPDPLSLFTTKKRPARQAPFWKRFITPDLIFGVGLAMIILFFILWTAARIDIQGETQNEPSPPAIADILLTPDSSPLEPDAEGNLTNVITPEENIENPNQAGDIQSGEVQPTTADNIQEDLRVVDGPSIPTATLPQMNNNPLQVYIIAHARAWLRVTEDEKVSFLGRVVPGNAYAFSGEKKVELLTGNGAALQVIFNQNDLGTLGVNGEVAGLVFSVDGAITPTPAFTPTPTQTPLATITPLPSPTSPATPTVTPFIPEN